MNQVVRSIRDRFGYYHVAVLMLDAEEQKLLLRAVSGGYVELFPRHYTQLVSQGLIGAAAAFGENHGRERRQPGPPLLFSARRPVGYRFRDVGSHQDRPARPRRAGHPDDKCQCL